MPLTAAQIRDLQREGIYCATDLFASNLQRFKRGMPLLALWRDSDFAPNAVDLAELRALRDRIAQFFPDANKNAFLDHGANTLIVAPLFRGGAKTRSGWLFRRRLWGEGRPEWTTASSVDNLLMQLY